MSYRRRVPALLLVVLALLTVGCGSGSASNRTKAAPIRKTSAETHATAVQVASLRHQVDLKRQATWKWQDKALVKRTPTAYHEHWAKGTAYLRSMANLWAQRLQQARHYAQHPPHLAMWLCIHGGEASWIDHASHNPHYGGLQMGDWFMRTYASELLDNLGTADHWSPMTQIWVAEHAFAREGYSQRWLLGQWPSTAPPCI